MLNKLRSVEFRFEELCAKSEQPDLYSDPKLAAKLLREKNDLSPSWRATGTTAVRSGICWKPRS